MCAGVERGCTKVVGAGVEGVDHVNVAALGLFSFSFSFFSFFFLLWLLDGEDGIQSTKED